jgi:NADH:ubiquinone oxidoreductase subunit E
MRHRVHKAEKTFEQELAEIKKKTQFEDGDAGLALLAAVQEQEDMVSRDQFTVLDKIGAGHYADVYKVLYLNLFFGIMVCRGT